MHASFLQKLAAPFGEYGIPALSWIIITLPLWLSPFHPAVVAYFIIAFDLYFLYKSVTTSFFAALAYRQILLNTTIPYRELLKKIPESNEVVHCVIIPNYNEPLEKLTKSIKRIAESDYPYKNIVLILAFEARENDAQEKAESLKKQFGGFFKDILTTYHTLLPNEVAGKASNQTAAARELTEYARKHQYDDDKILLTVCDADSMLPHHYFSYLTHTYLTDPQRKFHFYWAPVLLYNNFWQLPFFVRMQATLSSILRIAILSQNDRLIQVSTYSTSLWLIREVGYWDVDIIPEDWHIYFQAFFTFGDKVRTIPLYTIINGDAVYSGGLIKTFINRYEQEKRWAWGVTDIAYCWRKMFITPHIPFFAKLKKTYFLMETHLFWPTSFFILTISASIPPLINPVFKRTVLGFLLPQLSGIILTIASLMILVYVYLDIKLRQNLKIPVRKRFLPLMLVQWFLLPAVSFVLSAIPALEAHTRILLRKKIEYKVTEKA